MLPGADNLLACFQVSYVEAGQRYGIIEAVIHLVNRDFVALADLYKRLGFIPQEQVRRGDPILSCDCAPFASLQPPSACAVLWWYVLCST